jgi:6-pyruvoyltetrahydropterin/6-carboxytetrahydropterin synthase
LVTVTGVPVLDISSTKLGMVMDFGDLKNIVREYIIDEFDHALVLNITSASDFTPDAEMFGRTILVNYQPTSENMLIDFVERLRNHLPANVKLHHLLLRETVTSYAEWFASDNE